MISLNAADAVHKAWLYRLLIAIVDNDKLQQLHFKGGTCAAMCGFLDRFSVDLDFDYLGSVDTLPEISQEFRRLFKDLGLEIKDSSVKVPQFFLKYPTKNIHVRNTVKIDVSYPVPHANTYQAIKLTDIDRVVVCQDLPTMFANKLVAVTDRFNRHQSVAGRDIYDIHHFFVNAYSYNGAVISERTGLTVLKYLQILELFVAERITNTILDQDLNHLIPYNDFRRLRKTLKIETLMFIREEIKRLK